MNVNVNRAALFEAVQLASSIVPARTPKPILQCAKLHTSNDKLIVTATDNEITITYSISQLQIVQEGSTVVPADRMTGILRESNDETVSIEVKDAVCEISGTDSHFKVFGQDADDFPVTETADQPASLKIKAQDLKSMISKVTFAAARESSRYAINGVLWECTGKKLRMVATDGRRLAQVDGEVSGAAKGEDHSAIVPIKTMSILERILQDPDEKIEITFSGNQIVIRTATVELSGILVQGRFPKYEDVIPSGCDKKIELNVSSLQSAVRRAALLTNENSRGILLGFSKGGLRLTSSTPEAGEAEVTMDVDYQAEPVEIGFNPQYVLEMLKVSDNDEVAFEFSDGKRPGLLKSGKNFLYVVMPVTV